MHGGPRGIRVATLPEGNAARPTPRCPPRSHLAGLGHLVTTPASAAGPECKHPGTSVPAPQINGTRFGNHRLGRWPIPGVPGRPRHCTRRLTLAGRVLRHPGPALPPPGEGLAENGPAILPSFSRTKTRKKTTNTIVPDCTDSDTECGIRMPADVHLRPPRIPSRPMCRTNFWT